jgi:SNF2 family DNA or RNA helicase
MGIRGPFLIVAPLSTLPHWQREFEAWSNMNCIVYHGNESARSLMRQLEWGEGAKRKGDQAYRFEVLVTTPEILMQDAAELGRIKWQFCAVDEAQRLKNAESKLSRSMREVTSSCY